MPLLQAPSLFLTSPIISIAQHQYSYCNHLSTEETGRRLGDRIRDRLYDIRKNDLSKPVSRHFNSSNHSISNFVVFSLPTCHRRRQLLAILIIFNVVSFINGVGTLNPYGINERLKFN